MPSNEVKGMKTIPAYAGTETGRTQMGTRRQGKWAAWQVSPSFVPTALCLYKTQDGLMGSWAYGLISLSAYKPISLLIVLCLVSCLAGCSATGRSVDVLFAAATSQLASARKAGAEQLVESEFEEAARLLAEAEIALKNRDKEARSLIQKAHSKARLAEALTKQSRAETEAAQLEAELEEALVEASRARLERQSAESELGQESP